MSVRWVLRLGVPVPGLVVALLPPGHGEVSLLLPAGPSAVRTAVLSSPPGGRRYGAASQRKKSICCMQVKCNIHFSSFGQQGGTLCSALLSARCSLPLSPSPSLCLLLPPPPFRLPPLSPPLLSPVYRRSVFRRVSWSCLRGLKSVCVALFGLMCSAPTLPFSCLMCAQGFCSTCLSVTLSRPAHPGSSFSFIPADACLRVLYLSHFCFLSVLFLSPILSLPFMSPVSLLSLFVCFCLFCPSLLSVYCLRPVPWLSGRLLSALFVSCHPPSAPYLYIFCLLTVSFLSPVCLLPVH